MLMQSEPNTELAPSNDGITSTMQAKAIQDTAWELVLRLKTDIRSSTSPELRVELASALRAATQAFDTAAERRRILQGKGLPKSVDVISNLKAARKQPHNLVAWETRTDQETAEPQERPKQQGIS